jgi:tetratricopeptide (TPR) repeat protein
VASSKQEHTAPQKKRLPYETHGFAGVMLCLVLLTFARIIADGKTIGRRYGFGIDVETTPVGAARFVRDNHLGQRLYNPPNYAYLDWHFGANHRLFYDIQADYPPATLSEAMASLQANLNPREYVRRWDFDVVLCPLTGTPSPLIPYLSRNPRWAVIYWDGTDVVFVRRLPRYAHFIRKHAYRYIKPFLSFAAVLAEREDAMAEIERALETAPKTFALYRLAASLYWSFGEDDKAQEMIQQAMKMHPNELQARELKSIFGCPR